MEKLPVSLATRFLRAATLPGPIEVQEVEGMVYESFHRDGVVVAIQSNSLRQRKLIGCTFLVEGEEYFLSREQGLTYSQEKLGVEEYKPVTDSKLVSIIAQYMEAQVTEWDLEVLPSEAG